MTGGLPRQACSRCSVDYIARSQRYEGMCAAGGSCQSRNAKTASHFGADPFVAAQVTGEQSASDYFAGHGRRGSRYLEILLQM